ncbi:MAG: hypothetical protein QM820_45705 [Minicystis sp.]
MLDERPDEFDHRNLFLHALLGMISAGRRLDAAAAQTSNPEAPPVAEDDPWLLCVLGMIAFRERLAGHLDRVEAPSAVARAERPASRLAIREILR